MVAAPARAEWKVGNVTNAVQKMELDVKDMRHVELKIADKQLREIENGGSHLFIHIVQKSLKGVGFTVSGSETAFHDYSTKGGAVIEGKTSTGPGTLVVIGPGSPIWKTIQKTKAAFLEVYSLGGATQSEISFYVREEAAVSSSERYEALTEGVEIVKFNLEMEKSNSGNHHFKFLIDSSSKSDKASISATGWKGAKRTKNIFNLTRYDKDKLGYVIDSSDPLYCGSGVCQYHIQVKLSNIKKIELYLGEHSDMETLHQNGHTVNEVSSRLDTSREILRNRISSTTESTKPIQ